MKTRMELKVFSLFAMHHTQRAAVYACVCVHCENKIYEKPLIKINKNRCAGRECLVRGQRNSVNI